MGAIDGYPAMTGVAPPRPGVRFAARGHTRIAYVVTGPDDSDPDVPTVCFLHGLLLGRDTFAPVREALAGHGPVRTIEIDARGHGASAALTDRGYTLADAAMETLAVLDRAGSPAVHLVGHDLGGMTALVLASIAPGRVTSLTLVEPAAEALLIQSDDADIRSRGELVRRVRREIAETAYKGLLDQALDRYLRERWGRTWQEGMATAHQAAIRRNANALAPSLRALDAASIDHVALAGARIPLSMAHWLGSAPDITAVADLLSLWVPSITMIDTEPPLRPNQPFGGSSLGPSMAEALSQTILGAPSR